MRHGRHGWIRGVACVGVLVLGASCAGGEVPNGPADTDDLRYVGPAVGFDIPSGWHEFNLDLNEAVASEEAPLGYFAAYGPVDGGDDDYVSVAPLPEQFASGSTEEVLDGLAPPGQRPAQGFRPVDVNGLEGHRLVNTDQGLRWVLTYVVGERGRYLIACRSGEHMVEEIMRGCETAAGSLIEMQPPAFVEPSGCTERELAMIDEIPVPAGAEPELLTGRDPEGGHSCDFGAVFSDGGDGGVVGFMEEALGEAGWTIEFSGVDRQMERFDVHRVIGMRDFDMLMVEVYVDDDFTQNYFVTAFDG